MTGVQTCALPIWSEFRSPRELGRILAREPACQKCVVKQLFRYATGRFEEENDDRVLDEVLARFRNSGFHFRELILGLAGSEVFTGAADRGGLATNRAR